MMEFKITNVQYNADLGIFPRLKFEVNISTRDPHNFELNSRLLVTNIKLMYNGQTVSLADPIITGEQIGGGQVIQTNSFYFNLDREKLRAIEIIRTDDIKFDVFFDFLWSFSTNDHPTTLSYQHRQEVYQLKLSQKEWTTILKAMRFYEAWIVEIARPHIEGISAVVGHIEKASACLHNRQFEDCMANIRVAWNALNPIIDAKWTEISQFIDSDSPGENGHDPKSKRIQDMKSKLVYFSQVGVHREFYKVNPEDAILSYYQSVSVISYISQIIKKIELKKL